MCEGLVPISSLNGDFVFDEENYALISSSRIFKLGYKARVKVYEADIISRKVTFSLISCDEAEIPKSKRVQIPYKSKSKPDPKINNKGSKSKMRKHTSGEGYKSLKGRKKQDGSKQKKHSRKHF
jgi:hypothetical protein